MTTRWQVDEIALVRHAQSKANTRELVPMQYGDHAIPLTDEGVKQATAAGAGLADFIRSEKTVVYCSPYTRTRQTLVHLLAGAGLQAADYSDYEDPRLREVDRGYGSVEGFVAQQRLRERHGWFYYRFDGGESPADCYDRVSGFVDSMFRQAERKQARRVLVVSHGLTIRCLVMRFLHLKPEDYDRMDNPGNASVAMLRCSDDEKKHEGAVFRRGRWSVHGLALREESTKRDHCFDGLGWRTSTGHSSTWSEKCCQCGEERTLSSSMKRDGSHGPHVSVLTPGEPVVTKPPASEFCTPKPQSSGQVTLTAGSSTS